MKTIYVRLMLTGALAFFFTNAFAASELANYIRPVGNWVLALGLIVGAAGAGRIAFNWGDKEKDMNTEVQIWFGACILLVLSGLVVRAFTGF